MRTWRKLWQDERGFVASSELILLATVVAVGMIAGVTTLRNAVIGELADVGAALGDVNQSYSFNSVSTSAGTVNGSIYVDQPDFCELPGNNDRVCSAPLCIRVCLNPDATPE